MKFIFFCALTLIRAGKG